MPYTIKLPKSFFDDHAARELPTPEVIRETRAHYIVSKDDLALPELLSDARYYSDGLDMAPRGIVVSARATVRALIAEAA